MISPWTPAGTKVVFIGGPEVVSTLHGARVVGARHPFTMDAVYTVREIEANPASKSGFVVYLVEVPGWFCGLPYLRPLNLPDSITSALTSQPLLIEETV